MRLLRGVAGALLWVVAAVVGLVGALLSVTVIGLPLGIPLLLGARRMFTAAVRLMLPSHVAHPVKEAKGSTRTKAKEGVEKLSSAVPDTSKAKKRTKKITKKAAKTGRKGKSRGGKFLSSFL